MLDNIENAQSLKIEGEEDIEIKTNDGKTILAQAKSVIDPSDYSHVRENLKKALTSLSEGATHVNARQLILVTNSTNPFNDVACNGLFWGSNTYNYQNLPVSSRRLIDSYLSTIHEPMDPSLFWVQRIPFSTDDENERARAIKERIRDFLGEIMITTPGLHNRLYDIWSNQLFFNGTTREQAIVLSKKSFIWPIIVLETDINYLDEDVIDQFDEAMYEEITRSYHTVIDTHCERYEFVSRVLYDYSAFEYTGEMRKKAGAFTNALWEQYKDEFCVPGIPNEIIEGLTKIVLYSIVRRRLTIEKIRRGMHL